VALANLETEKVSYSEVKRQLKETLILASAKNQRRADDDQSSVNLIGLIKMVAHNLACLNYVEMLEFAENPPEASLDELQQQLDQVESKKALDRAQDAQTHEAI